MVSLSGGYGHFCIAEDVEADPKGWLSRVGDFAIRSALTIMGGVTLPECGFLACGWLTEQYIRG